MKLSVLVSTSVNKNGLQRLSLVDRDVTDIDLLPPKFSSVSTLFMSSNQISNLANITQFKSLRVLSLANNNITEISSLEPLKSLRATLKVLNLEFNPVCKTINYRAKVIQMIPSLTFFDSYDVTHADVALTDKVLLKEISLVGIMDSNSVVIFRLFEILKKQRVFNEIGMNFDHSLKILFIFDIFDKFGPDSPLDKFNNPDYQFLKFLHFYKKSNCKTILQRHANAWSKTLSTVITNQNNLIADILGKLSNLRTIDNVTRISCSPSSQQSKMIDSQCGTQQSDGPDPVLNYSENIENIDHFLTSQIIEMSDEGFKSRTFKKSHNFVDSLDTCQLSTNFDELVIQFQKRCNNSLLGNSFSAWLKFSRLLNSLNCFMEIQQENQKATLFLTLKFNYEHRIKYLNLAQNYYNCKLLSSSFKTMLSKFQNFQSLQSSAQQFNDSIVLKNAQTSIFLRYFKYWNFLAQQQKEYVQSSYQFNHRRNQSVLRSLFSNWFYLHFSLKTYELTTKKKIFSVMKILMFQKASNLRKQALFLQFWVDQHVENSELESNADKFHSTVIVPINLRKSLTYWNFQTNLFRDLYWFKSVKKQKVIRSFFHHWEEKFKILENSKSMFIPKSSNSSKNLNFSNLFESPSDSPFMSRSISNQSVFKPPSYRQVHNHYHLMDFTSEINDLEARIFSRLR
ncbi:hypothetical protein GEMRC1_005085 [Eukaryota sp. GEM-RC1]